MPWEARTKMANKYVITGGPCVGKSTLIAALQEKGYQTLPEVARLVIEEQQGTDGKILPWIDRDSFQQAVMKRQLELEGKVNGKPVFLDRGLADGAGYYLADNLKVPRELNTAINENRYSGVFLLDPLKDYKTDSARVEDSEAASRIHGCIGQAYENAGYKVVRVPAVSVEERVKFILNEIRSKN